ncbi:hypothetical protein [Haloarcula halophila]|uniref:hypothetical protein n=1 Tax=Haloarcula halophila TaxID=3032584 RepID=UPI003AF32CBC
MSLLAFVFVFSLVLAFVFLSTLMVVFTFVLAIALVSVFAGSLGHFGFDGRPTAVGERRVELRGSVLGEEYVVALRFDIEGERRLAGIRELEVVE